MSSHSQPAPSAKKNLYLGMGISAGIIVVGIIFLTQLGGGSSAGATSSPPPSTTGVSTEDGKQIVTIAAKAGYRPRSVTAKANTPTTLRITTNNTFDCSASLRIPALGVTKFLDATGTFDVTVPPQSPGSKITGSCSMGMYGFTVTFES